MFFDRSPTQPTLVKVRKHPTVSLPVDAVFTRYTYVQTLATNHPTHLMTCRTLSQETLTVAALPVIVMPDLRNSRLNRPLGCRSCTPSKVQSKGCACSFAGPGCCPFDVDDGESGPPTTAPAADRMLHSRGQTDRGDLS